MADANSHMPCHTHAELSRGFEKSLSERHGHGMACGNQTQPGRGMVWERHGMCELALRTSRGAKATHRDFRSLPTVVFLFGHLLIVNQPQELFVSESYDFQH
jgi:hypothetical protein